MKTSKPNLWSILFRLFISASKPKYQFGGNMQTQQQLIPIIIFDMAPLGSLQVYVLSTSTDLQAQLQAPRGYYWRDAGSPQGHGPFEYISTAIEHYKWLINLSKGKGTTTGDINKSTSVIRVDFQNKKRVNT